MLTAHSKAVIAVNSLLPSLAVLAVILRLYARKLKRLCLRADDYVIILALIMTLGTCMPFIYCTLPSASTQIYLQLIHIAGATNGGMGMHLRSLTFDEAVIFGKVTFWTQFTYLFAVSLIKLSILLFYRSIFSTPRFCLAVNILCAILFLWTIAFFFASLFQAWPISYNWNEDQPGHTIDEISMYLEQACSELALDVIALTLPWTVIWRLQMKTSRKLSILGIFMLGGFVCVSSAFRIYYYNAFKTFQDFTYDSYNIFIWTAVEPCLGIVCACLPVLTPIFQADVFPGSLFSSIRSFFRSQTRILEKSSGVRNDHIRQGSKESSESWDTSFLDSPRNAVAFTNIQGRGPNDLESSNISRG